MKHEEHLVRLLAQRKDGERYEEQEASHGLGGTNARQKKSAVTHATRSCSRMRCLSVKEVKKRQ